MDHTGNEQRVLVIATTIPLDKADNSFKKSLVKRLSSAAREHLKATSGADAFVLVDVSRLGPEISFAPARPLVLR